MASENLFLRIVDGVNDRVGRWVSYLLIPLMLIVTLEVVLRYFFNSPTIWAWDINIQIASVLIVWGAGYTLLNNAHVKVDVITMRLSPQRRAVIDLITSSLFFICIGSLIWHEWAHAIWSIGVNEHLYTIWSPPIYPFKVLIPIGVMLLFFQGVAKFIRDLRIARSGSVES